MAAKYRLVLVCLLLLTFGVGSWLWYESRRFEEPQPNSQTVSLDSKVPEPVPAPATQSSPSRTLLVAAVSQFSPPYSCNASFQSYCIIPEVLKRVFKERGYQAEYVPVSLPREFIELSAGRLDAAMIYTNASLSSDDYPDTVHVCPVAAFRAPISAFARRDRPVELNTPEDLVNHHLVAIRLPSFQRGMLDAEVFPEITRTNSVRAIMTTLAAGRADYGLYEYYVGLYMIDQLRLEQTLYWVRDITYIDYHLAFSKKTLEQQPELLAMCDDIQRLREQGELETIVKRGRQALVEHLAPVMQRSFIEQRHPEIEQRHPEALLQQP